MGRVCSVDHRDRMGSRFFVVAAHFYDRLGDDDGRAILGALARINAAVCQLEFAAGASLSVVEKAKIGEECQALLQSASGIVQRSREKTAPILALLETSREKLLSTALPILQLKAQMMQQSAESNMQQFVRVRRNAHASTSPPL